MTAQFVTDYVAELKEINLNNSNNQDFSAFSWLNERKPVYSMKGEKNNG